MNKKNKLKAVCFGEVLWDLFPSYKTLGGAPLNVALRLKSFGAEVTMISSVGNDENGREILNQLSNFRLDTSTVSVSEEYPTGLVNVTLDQFGSASYEIAYPSAWDKIVLTKEANHFVSNADVLIFGSLACRDLVSRQVLMGLLNNKVYKVFDVNLRKPHYSYSVLEQLMNAAHFIKFNDEELLEIAYQLHSPYKDVKDNINYISEKTATQAICVTRGKHGAYLLWEGRIYENEGYSVEVSDTVGAGDSFLATLLFLLLTSEMPQKAIDYSCAVGALVAAAPGANPEISFLDIEHLIQS